MVHGWVMMVSLVSSVLQIVICVLCLLSVLSSFVSSVCLVFVCGPPKADDLRGREQKVSTY